MEESIKTVIDNKEKGLISGSFTELTESLNGLVSENIRDSDIKMFNPSLLAYIGDAVYEIFIRTNLIAMGYDAAGELHKRTVHFVEAKSQAKIIDSIYELLTDEEKYIVKRGRNTKTSYVPKNAKIADYKYATGFESLLGFLYLNKRTQRLLEILNYSAEIEI